MSSTPYKICFIALITFFAMGCEKTERVFIEVQLASEMGDICFNPTNEDIWVDTYIFEVYETREDDIGCGSCYDGYEGCRRYRQCHDVERHQIVYVTDLQPDLQGLEIGAVSPDEPLCIRLLAVDISGEPFDCDQFDPKEFFEYSIDTMGISGPPGICATTMGTEVLSIADGVVELQACSVTAEPLGTSCIGELHPPL